LGESTVRGGGEMIDPQRGGLLYDIFCVAMQPHITRQEFSVSAWATASSNCVIDEPWHPWNLAGKSRSHTTACAVSIFIESVER